jgi:hypothetical protein
MSTTFPTSLQAFTNPTGSDSLNTPWILHTDQHANINDTVEAIQAKIGIDWSWDTNSIDYKLWTKQATLVSWTNIKTINWNSVLWSWDLTIAWWFTYLSWGCLEVWTFTTAWDWTINVPALDVSLFDNTYFEWFPVKYTLTWLTNQILTNNATNYIVWDYNGWSPIMKVITDVNLITESNIIPIFTVYRNWNYLHTQNWDSLWLWLANKVHQSIVKTQRYRREYWLALTETWTRNLILTEWKIWTWAVPIVLWEILTATDNAFLWYHNAWVWTQSVVAQYNKTQYDNWTNLVTLTAWRYAVNWIYRWVESQKHLYIVLW